MSVPKKILLITGLILLLITSYFYRQNSLAMKFVDEEHNFTTGRYMAKGEKVYKDIISNHQPLTYIISAQVEKITPPKNGYFLLVNHRMALLLWGAAWSLILIASLGLPALVFIIIYELTKIHLLGNLFLAESLVVYPLIYLLGAVFRNQLNRLQIFIFGLSFGLAVFLLLPIWPGLFFLLFIAIFKNKNHLTCFGKFFLLGFIIPLATILIYTDVPNYFYYTLFTNLTYTIPSYQNSPLAIDFIKSIFGPLIAFLPYPQTPTLTIIRLFSLCLLISLLHKPFKKIVLIVILLGLLNIRFITPGTEGYSGFHILPWYASLIFLTLLLINEVKGRINILNFCLILIALVVSVTSAGNLFKKTDMLNDYNINYSTHLSLGDTVKIMKDESSTLFVSPNAWLVYWQSDTKHLPKLYGDYTWMSGLPELERKVAAQFEQTPPTFFYCENCKGLSLEKYLSKYSNAKKNGSSTFLYVLPEKIKGLTQDQINQLNSIQVSF